MVNGDCVAKFKNWFAPDNVQDMFAEGYIAEIDEDRQFVYVYKQYFCPDPECPTHPHPLTSLQYCQHMGEDHGWTVEQIERMSE